MKPVSEMTDEEFAAYVASVMHRELGLDGYVRFLRTYISQQGADYTRDRHKWLGKQTALEIMTELEALAQKHGANAPKP
jgi:hypothetical protein